MKVLQKKKDEEFLEFDSMINLRPNQGNKSRDVDSEEVRKIISEIANHWIIRS